MNDSVREELKDKISIAPKPIVIARPNPPVMASKPKPLPPVVTLKTEPPVDEPVKPQPVLKPHLPVPVKTHTTEIMAKPTSPTLVEFQNKNATMPDWRLQLQNAVRKRVENGQQPAMVAEPKPMTVSRVHLPTNGGAALKAEIVEETLPAGGSNPKLAAALRRIEESRKKFLTEEPKEDPAPKTPLPASKNYPFYIATKNAEILPKPVEAKPAEARPAAPALSAPIFEELPVLEKKEYDTNKLKPLPNAAVISTSVEKMAAAAPAVEEPVIDAPLISISRVVIDEETDEILELEETEFIEEDEETEDLAPFAMRFNSGVFDLIIGAFTSLILLAPFMLSGRALFSLAGFMAFLVTCAIVMFVYLTTAIGMFGKTVGMKIFSLETIDIEENDYPTFHQAAVSSSVYLVSLALGGIGFLPAFFNSERRTAPDLLSGTIIVKE